MKVIPFRPGAPVNPDMFIGRLDELTALDDALCQTGAGYPTNFLITGERGIGKTSLLLYVGALAVGALPGGDKQSKCLLVSIDIAPDTTQLGFIKTVRLGIEQQLVKTEGALSFIRSAWSFLQRLEAGGVRIREGDALPSETLLADFAYSLAQTINRICSDEARGLFSAQYSGALILIDEADNSSPDLDLGTLLKLLLERVQRHGCSRLMIGLAGLPRLRDVLSASHPSALRLFSNLELARLSDHEAGMVLDRGVNRANEINEEPIELDNEARAVLIRLSEGYPHFIQQFAYSAFNADEDGVVREDDVWKGAFGESGALKEIGNRYYRDDFYRKILKDSYRQVLRIMADRLDRWITKKEIRSQFKGNDSTLDNAIKALRDRSIILSKEGERGVYRLQQQAFALWIKIHASGPPE